MRSHVMLDLAVHAVTYVTCDSNPSRTSPRKARECRQHNYDPLSMQESAQRGRSASSTVRTKRNSSTGKSRGLGIDLGAGANMATAESRFSRALSPRPTWQPARPYGNHDAPTSLSTACMAISRQSCTTTWPSEVKAFCASHHQTRLALALDGRPRSLRVVALLATEATHDIA